MRIIASDVDGTLLDSQQKLRPAVVAAVRAADAAGVPVRGQHAAPVLKLRMAAFV